MALILDGTDGITSSGGTNVLQDDAVITANIADGAVSDAKIAAMAAAKLTGRVPAANVNLGGVLQVVQTTKNDATSTTSSTFGDISGMSVSITPSSASSKILVMFSIGTSNGSGSQNDLIKLVRNSTDIAIGTGTPNATVYARVPNNGITYSSSMTFLDSPNTTSALTYKLQWRTSGGTLFLNRPGDFGTILFFSSITVMEIAG